VHLVAVLKGAFVFLADLMRQMSGELSIDFIALSSYAEGTTSSGECGSSKTWTWGSTERTLSSSKTSSIPDGTLVYLQDIFRARQPRQLATVCLLDKPSRRQVDVTVNYVGFTIEDRFVVGYGLDCAERYRHLPYLAVLPLIP